MKEGPLATCSIRLQPVYIHTMNAIALLGSQPLDRVCYNCKGFDKHVVIHTCHIRNQVERDLHR
jgi:hypothetical protein